MWEGSKAAFRRSWMRATAGARGWNTPTLLSPPRNRVAWPPQACAVRRIAAAEPALASGTFYAGRSFGDSSANKGSFFLRLKPFAERGGGRNSTPAVAERLNAQLRRKLSLIHI